jgi:hypothetical protein
MFVGSSPFVQLSVLLCLWCDIWSGLFAFLNEGVFFSYFVHLLCISSVYETPQTGGKHVECYCDTILIRREHCGKNIT